MHRQDIVIVTPALADANNGNWQTAQRWAGMLRSVYGVRLAASWDGGDEAVMIALHARRSAASVVAWKRHHPARPVVVVLTGTDLYRDIDADAAAQATIREADRLVVLNELGADALPSALRAKTRVVLQSCSARRPLAKSRRLMRALMVGHLREEKSPGTYLDAAALLAGRPALRFDHIGGALDPALGDLARALAASQPSYRWLGALPHAAVRRRVQAAHVLVHPSRIEGGANVVVEALRSGTPVLASRIDGNVGLLGGDYDGYFPVGDASGLASGLRRLHDDPAMLGHLRHQCAARAVRFDPLHERASLLAALADLAVLFPASGAAR